jgi:hypothetical protein
MGELRSLDMYIAAADAILTPVVDDDVGWIDAWRQEHACGRGKDIFDAYGARAWRDYWTRAWCRLEAFLAATLPPAEGAGRCFTSAALVGRRPHLLYGTLEAAAPSRGKIWVLPSLSGAWLAKYHPAEGGLTKEADRSAVAALLQRHEDAVAAVGGGVYEGEADAEGRPHGRGRETLPDYTVYEGAFRHGRREGAGAVWYANGLRFEGDFAADARCGAGREWWANGALKYEGAFERSQRHGHGRLFLESGQLEFEGRFERGTPVSPGPYGSYQHVLKN